MAAGVRGAGEEKREDAAWTEEAAGEGAGRRRSRSKRSRGTGKKVHFRSGWN